MKGGTQKAEVERVAPNDRNSNEMKPRPSRRTRRGARSVGGRRSEKSINIYVLSLFISLFTFHVSLSSVKAQSISMDDPMEFYLRWVMEDGGQEGLPSFNLRPADISRYRDTGTLPSNHPWLRHLYFRTLSYPTSSDESYSIYTPRFYLSHNNAFPVDRNDGALWQGRGFNSSFTFGLGYKYGPIEAVFRPSVIYSENREFDLSDDPQMPGLSPFAMALTNSDIPQRFGENSLNQIDPGNSYIRLVYEGWSAGFSNEHIWSGPAIYNPLMLSNNAPGFLHGFIGTVKPFEVLAGHIETRWFWGGLQESDYFDQDSSNNLRYITGLIFNYSPAFIPGLHLGFTRVAYSRYPEGGPKGSDLFMVFRSSPPYPSNPESVSDANARFTKGSIFVRWTMPESGIEAYVEWGRNDYKRILRDLLTEPEVNRGYVMGVIKRFNLGSGRRVVFNAELTNLENSSVASQYRDEATIWYANDVIRQGFTHQGQVLGAGIGPGSSTEYVGVRYYDSWGMAGASVRRIVHHNDRLFQHREYYHSTLPRPWMSIRWLHEVEFRYTLNALVFLPWNIELEAEYEIGKIENHNNSFDRTPNSGPEGDIHFDVSNTRLAFTVRYNMTGWRR